MMRHKSKQEGQEPLAEIAAPTAYALLT